jgi:hypothetical protein
MDILGILFLVVLILSIFAFGFFLYKSASSWGVLHSLLISFLFLESIAFLVASAGVLQRRGGWVRLHDSLSKKVVDAQKESVTLKYGELTNPTQDITKLFPLQNALGRLTLDRGRVWNSATLVQTQGNNVQLNLGAQPAAAPAAADPAADPAAGGAAPAAAPAAAPTGNSLPPNTVVYAFTEKADESGRLLPTSYLGEFVVADNQNGTVTLTPTLRSPQYDKVVGESNQWSLYELMPLDSHDAFAEVGSASSEDALFGRMDPDVLNKIFAALPESNRQAVIDSYTRDGQAANDNDPPDVVWERIKFIKDFSLDVDSLQVSTALDGGYFDDDGRTVDNRLKRGEGKERVEFKVDDEIDFVFSKAEELIQQGVAKLIKRYYVRSLNDYDDGFRLLDRHQFDVTERIAWMQRETAVLTEANRIAGEQIQGRQVEIANLKKEQVQYGKELEVVSSEATRLTEELEKTRTKLSELFRETQAMHSKLVAENARLQEIAGPGLASLENEKP